MRKESIDFGLVSYYNVILLQISRPSFTTMSYCFRVVIYGVLVWYFTTMSYCFQAVVYGVLVWYSLGNAKNYD